MLAQGSGPINGGAHRRVSVRAAGALRVNGVDVLEFWNHGARSGDPEGENARFLRRHVLGLPIHQDLTPRHIDHVAAQVLRRVCG